MLAEDVTVVSGGVREYVERVMATELLVGARADTVFEIYAQGASRSLKVEFNYLQYTEYDPERTADRTFKTVCGFKRKICLAWRRRTRLFVTCHF